MPNRFYLKGTRAEYIVRDDLRQEGWLVMRSYASRGAFDLLAIRRGHVPLLVAVKSHGARMRPAERERLLEEAERYGAEPIQAHYERGTTTWTNLRNGGVGISVTGRPASVV